MSQGTLMTTLVVQRPRGQRDEVFHDRSLDRLDQMWANSGSTARVYSYRVLDGNTLKVYSHPVRIWDWGIEWSTVGDGMEVAHFRPAQWDMVRNGR